MKTKTQSEITWNFQFEDNEFAVAMLFVYLNSTKTNKAQPTRTWKIIEVHTLIKYEHLKTKKNNKVTNKVGGALFSFGRHVQ